MSSPSNYPAVDSAYREYESRNNGAPRDATQLTRWAKRYLSVNLVYANVNKYLRIKEGKPAETPKAVPSKRFRAKSVSTTSTRTFAKTTRNRPKSVESSSSHNTLPKKANIAKSTSFQSVFNAPTRQRGATDPTSTTQRSSTSKAQSPSPLTVQTDSNPSEITTTKMAADLDLDSEIGVELWLRQFGYHNMKVEGGDSLLSRLKAQGCETLRDLTFLQDREDVDAFMVDLKMRPMHQPPFRRQVLLLVSTVRDGPISPRAAMPEITAQVAEVKDEEPDPVDENDGDDAGMLGSRSVPEKRKSIQMNRAEDQAVSRLTAAIKSHTVALQRLEPNAGDVQNEAQTLMREIEEKFEDIRQSVEMARAQLLKNLTLAESDATNKIQAEQASVRESATNLLKCRQAVTAPLQEAVDEDQRRERAQFVVNEISEALTNAPSSMYEHHLLFQTEDVDFQELLANYGKIIIQRRKIRANNGGQE